MQYQLFGGENGLLARAQQARKAQIESEMKEALILAIQELQLEKSGKATLDDITQEWIEITITDYECEVAEDASIDGKKVNMKKDNEKCKYIIDKNLNVTEVKIDEIDFSYEAKSRDGNNVNIVITIIDNENEIKEIVVPSGNRITTNGKKEIQIDYIVELGNEYEFIIVTKDGTEKQEKVLISEYYHDITKELSDEITIDNVEIKAAYNKSYEANITVAEGYIIDSLVVTMGTETIETDKTIGKIYIEKVTDDIKITAVAKKLEIEVSEIIIGTTTTATTSVADYSQQNGTTLYINFSATLAGTACTISPAVPYQITTLGTYKFTVTGKYGEKELTKEVEVVVNKYQIYEIRTQDDLQNIKNDRYGIYYLMNDIDMTDYNWTMISNFNGVIDGQGYTISNLTVIDQPGMFQYVGNATVKNILFKNIYLEAASQNYTGLFGHSNNGNNKFEKVGITGQIKGNGGSSGSFFGRGNGNSLSETFIDCYARTVLDRELWL